MRVLVLLPTTGALNRVVRLEARPDLPASGVYARHDFRPLAITADYDALTARSGPLAALGSPVRAGVHRLWLEGPIEAGKSWELPVLLAHLVTALGAELAAAPSGADLVLWSTGAVDLDLRIPDHDYRLAAKAAHSIAVLTEAAAHGAAIVALVPACADAAPLREALAQAGVTARIESVDGVAPARAVVEAALRGRAVTVAAPPGGRRRAVRAAAVIAAVAVLGLGVVHAAMPWASRLAASWLQAAAPDPGPSPGGGASAADAGHGGAPDAAQEPPAQESVSKEPAGQASGDAANDVTREAAKEAAKEAGKETAKETAKDGGDAAPPPAAAGHDGDAAAPAVVAAPLRLMELRDPRGLMCVAVLSGERPPRAVEVAVDAPGRFHDSVGADLCGLEWTLTPEAAAAGIAGFDIDLAAERLGARVIRTPAGASCCTRITVQFERDLGRSQDFGRDPGRDVGKAGRITAYRANLRFTTAPPPGQLQVFAHALR